MRGQILVIEEDPAVASALAAYLQAHESVAVAVLATGASGLHAISRTLPDAVVLDTTLPDISGWEICRMLRARERTAQLPLLLLGERSALGSVTGLELGADDYITKPADPREVAVRLKRAIDRRLPQSASFEEKHFRGSRICARFDEVVVTVDGGAISLTRRELRLLYLFVHARNQVLDRRTLVAGVPGSPRQLRSVDAAVWRLRTKLGQAGGQIETVPGFGYRFNEP